MTINIIIEILRKKNITDESLMEPGKQPISKVRIHQKSMGIPKTIKCKRRELPKRHVKYYFFYKKQEIELLKLKKKLAIHIYTLTSRRKKSK